MFHGTGQTPEHILPHARDLHTDMPHTDIICPLGPAIFTSRKLGIRADQKLRTWVKHDSLQERTRFFLRGTFNRLGLLNDLNNFIDAELQNRNLSRENLGLLGFSLGGSIALLTAFSHKTGPAAVAAHSAMLFPYHYTKSTPPTLWIMGDQDKRYDILKKLETKRRTGLLSQYFNYYHAASIKRLEKDSIPVEIQIIKGLDHDMSPESMHYTAMFLKRHLER